MRRIILTWCVGLCGLTLAVVANGAVHPRPARPALGPVPPRILNVLTDAGQMFIAGQNLPSGVGVSVRLGDAELEVVHSTPSLIIVKIPRLLPGRDYGLVIRRGVRTVSLSTPATTWGFLLPKPSG